MTLKEIIEPLHRRAEQMSFTQRMMRGELTIEEYTMYLYQMKQIFRKLEWNELPHPDLKRYVKISEDIKEIELPSYNLGSLPSTDRYAAHIGRLTVKEQLPHIYVNYMALMYGGQMMKSGIPGSGRIYEFDNLKECIQSIRDLQHEGWGHEANVGLLYNIAILDELQKVFRQDS